MKMNFGKRLVLFVHWLMSLALCAFVVALFISSGVRAALPGMVQGVERLVFAIAVLIVYLIFSAGALAITFSNMRRWRERNFIIVSSSGLGRTQISVAAVEQMIRQAMRNVSGVAEMKTEIVNNADSIEIIANVVLENGAHVPTVTANAQRAIRGYIEQNCGVEVKAVTVSVHSLLEDAKAEKQTRKKKTKVAIDEEPTPVFNVPEEPAPQALTPEPEAVEESVPTTEEAAETEAEPEPGFDEDAFEPVADAAEEAQSDEDFDLASQPAQESFEQAPEEESAETPEEEAPEAVVSVEVPAEDPVSEPAEPEKKPKKKGLFARLFGRGKKEPEPEATPESPAEETPESTEEFAPEAEADFDEPTEVSDEAAAIEYEPTEVANKAEPEDEPAEEAEPEMESAEEAEPEDESFGGEDTFAEMVESDDILEEDDADADDAEEDVAFEEETSQSDESEFEFEDEEDPTSDEEEQNKPE